MWIIRLTGDTCDLSMLARSFTDDDIGISQDGDSYVLMPNRFAKSDDARGILEEAERLVDILKGVCYTWLHYLPSIKVGSVYRRDEYGKRHMFLFAEPLEILLRVGPAKLAIRRADGTIEELGSAVQMKQSPSSH